MEDLDREIQNADKLIEKIDDLNADLMMLISLHKKMMINFEEFLSSFKNFKEAL